MTSEQHSGGPGDEFAASAIPAEAPPEAAEAPPETVQPAPEAAEAPPETVEPAPEAAEAVREPAEPAPDAESLCLAAEALRSDPHPEARRHDMAELRRRFQELESSGREAVRGREGRFHRAEKEFNALLHQRYEARDLERWANYTLKCDIAKELEELFAGDDSTLRKTVPRLKVLHSHWHRLHAVPQEKQAELKERYDKITKAWHARLDTYFAELDVKRREASGRKQEIVEAAEALADSREWNATSETLKAFQVEWRTLPGAPEPQERELFKRFRAACDRFFNARNAWFKERREYQQAAAETRETCIAELEAVDLALPADELRRIADGYRRRWRESGSAGRQSEELFARFNQALDRIYASVRAEQESAAEQHRHWEEKVTAMIEALEATDSPDSEAVREAAREINFRGRLPRIGGRDGYAAEERETALVRRYQEVTRKERAMRHRSDLEAARQGGGAPADLRRCRLLTGELERFAPAEGNPGEVNAADLLAAIQANFGGAPTMTAERVEAIVKDFLAASPPPEEIDRFNAALERVYAKLAQ